MLLTGAGDDDQMHLDRLEFRAGCVGRVTGLQQVSQAKVGALWTSVGSRKHSCIRTVLRDESYPQRYQPAGSLPIHCICSDLGLALSDCLIPTPCSCVGPTCCSAVSLPVQLQCSWHRASYHASSSSIGPAIMSSASSLAGGAMWCLQPGSKALVRARSLHG